MPSPAPPAVWIARPAHRAGPLVAALKQHGVRPLVRPALVVRDIPNPSPPPDDCDFAIIVSAEAATRLPASFIGRASVMAVGTATAKALETVGTNEPAHAGAGNFHLAAEPAGDSNSLLRLSLLQKKNIVGKRVAIIGGASADTPSPSPPLCAELSRRGAEVYSAVLYRREPSPPDDGALSRLAASGVLRATTAFSGETIRAMLTMTLPQNNWLQRLPLFVHHPAVAETATDLGFSEVIVSENIPAAIIAKIKK